MNCNVSGWALGLLSAANNLLSRPLTCYPTPLRQLLNDNKRLTSIVVQNHRPRVVFDITRLFRQSHRTATKQDQEPPGVRGMTCLAPLVFKRFCRGSWQWQNPTACRVAPLPARTMRRPGHINGLWLWRTYLPAHSLV